MDKKVVVSVVTAIVVFGWVAGFIFGDVAGSGDMHSVALDGFAPIAENVTAGSYPIQRDLIICTDGMPTGDLKCFIDWITSEEGQGIVSTEFIPLPERQWTNYEVPSNPNTVINVGGSTSMLPMMIRLSEVYQKKFGVTVTVSGGGSGVGASNTINGEFDIGMCSRDLNQSELDEGLLPYPIGIDAIAVIVNSAGISNLTIDQLSKIYSGEVTNWKQLGGWDKDIAVVARDDGSGTRDCFDQAMGEDWTMKSEVVKYSSTGGVVGTVRIVDGAIGYVSLGHLHIDG